jgi:hypothetical protein
MSIESPITESPIQTLPNSTPDSNQYIEYPNIEGHQVESSYTGESGDVVRKISQTTSDTHLSPQQYRVSQYTNRYSDRNVGGDIVYDANGLEISSVYGTELDNVNTNLDTKNDGKTDIISSSNQYQRKGLISTLASSDGYMSLDSIESKYGSVTLANLDDGEKPLLTIIGLPSTIPDYYPKIDFTLPPYDEHTPRTFLFENLYNQRSPYTLYGVTTSEASNLFNPYVSALLADKGSSSSFDHKYTGNLGFDDLCLGWWGALLGINEPSGSFVMSKPNDFSGSEYAFGSDYLNVKYNWVAPSSPYYTFVFKARVYTQAESTFQSWENIYHDDYYTLTLEYNDGSTPYSITNPIREEENVLSDERLRIDRFETIELAYPESQNYRINNLKSVQYSFSIDPYVHRTAEFGERDTTGCWGFIVLDYLETFIVRDGGYMSTVLYEIETPFLQTSNPTQGIDFKTMSTTPNIQIESISLSIKATMTSQEESSRTISFMSPKFITINGKWTTNHFRIDQYAETILYNIPINECNLDKTFTWTTRSQINSFLNYIIHDEGNPYQDGGFYYTNNSRIALMITSSSPFGDLRNNAMTIDYLHFSITYSDHLDQQTSNYRYLLDTDSTNPISFQETFPIKTLAGNTPKSITIYGNPSDWNLYKYTYISNGILKESSSSPLSITDQLIPDLIYTNIRAITFNGLTDQSNFTLFFSGGNYWKNQNISYSREVSYGNSMKTTISRNNFEFLHGDNIKIDCEVFPAPSNFYSFLGEGIVVAYFIDKDDNIVYSQQITRTKPTEFNSTINLGISNFNTHNPYRYFEYNTTYSIFFTFINSQEITKAGYYYWDNAFTIKPNKISDPTYSFDSDFIYYSFNVSAKGNYSAMVVSQSVKSTNYIGETQKYPIGMYSNNINLTNVYIDNQYIKGINTFTNLPNTNIIFEFENLGLTAQNIIIDDMRIVPYFYRENTFQNYTYRNATTFSLEIGETKNISFYHNYYNYNSTISRGIFTPYIQFHEEFQPTNQSYMNCTLFSESDITNYGKIYNYTIFENLTGSAYLQGNFTKNIESSKLSCYIMDEFGQGNSPMWDISSGYYFGNQYTPTIEILSPDQGEEFSTSYIPLNLRVNDPNSDLDKVYVRYSSDMIDSEYYLMNTTSTFYPKWYYQLLNPFELATGMITFNVMAYDLNENYMYQTFYISVISYKQISLENENISIGKVNIYPSATYIPCSVFVNYSQYYADPISTYFFDLGSNYTDARNYKIQRSPINIYYAIKSSREGISDVGRYSYWNFAETTEIDKVQFALNAPISTITADIENTIALQQKVYDIRLKRHTNIRTYSQPSIIFSIDQPFDNLLIKIYDTTGGDNISITDSCNLQYGLIGSEGNFIINFTIKEVLENVDYAFKIFIYNIVTYQDLIEEARNANMIIGVLLFGSIAISIRILVSYKGGQYAIREKNMKKELGIYGGIGAVVGILFGYFVGFSWW